MLDYGQVELLFHPLTQKIMECKWYGIYSSDTEAGRFYSIARPKVKFSLVSFLPSLPDLSSLLSPLSSLLSPLFFPLSFLSSN